MKKYSKILFAAILALSVFGTEASAQELLSNTVSKDTILIGDQVLWESRLKVPRGMNVEVDSMSGYVVPGVELLGDFTIDTLKKKKGYSIVGTKALITSFDSGSYMLPPLVLYLTRNGEVVDTVRLNEIPFEVTTIPVDTASFEMNDIRPQFNYPVTFSEVFPWVLLALAVGGLIAFLCIWLVRRRKGGTAGPVKAKPGEPAHVVALRQLEKIQSEELWQKGKQKQFYTEVTDALRQYIEGRFGLRTLERTSNEILDDLSSQEITSEDFERLKGIFGTSDLVKFAKYTASPEENGEIVPSAVKFVNDTVKQEEA